MLFLNLRRNFATTGQWRTIVGLEIHAQLASKTKLFSNSFNDTDVEANTNVAPFDIAMPGSLPMLNRECVLLALRAAVHFGCEIQKESQFDRKHYTYFDLPSGYQITQHHHPFATSGAINLLSKSVPLKQIHLEHDSAKFLHEGAVDANRCGIGLIEIVTQPEMYSANEAVECAKSVWQQLRDLQVCKGILAQGHMRFDVNVSVTGPKAPSDAPPLGVRVEIKNINTFTGLRRAIEFEVARQVALLEVGQRVCKETRSYDEKTKTTIENRSKEDEVNYRYIQEFDLPLLQISKEEVELVRRNIPETREEKFSKLRQNYGLDQQQIRNLIQHPELLVIFENAVTAACNPIITCNFLTNKFLGILTRKNIELEENPLLEKDILFVISHLSDGDISNDIAQNLITLKLDNPDISIQQILIEQKPQQMEIPKDLEEELEMLAQLHIKRVEMLKGGNHSVADFFVGPLMKLNRNRVAPSTLRPWVIQFLSTK